MSNQTARNEARAALAVLANLGDKIVDYTGDKGKIETVGYIDKESGYVGEEGQSVATESIVVLLVEDVGQVRHGDRVTDEDGREWVLNEMRPSEDPLVTEWTAVYR